MLRELAFTAALLFAGALVVNGVRGYDEPAAWIVAGLIVAALTVFNFVEVGD